MQNKPVALVTGANKGIGLQIAKDLCAHGFTVLLGSRNLERGEIAAKSAGVDARALQLDVTDRASIAAAAKRIRRELGRLDVLVNNAAISHRNELGWTLEKAAMAGRASVISLSPCRPTTLARASLCGRVGHAELRGHLPKTTIAGP